MSSSSKFLKFFLELLLILGLLRSIVEAYDHSANGGKVVIENEEGRLNMKQNLFEEVNIGRKKQRVLAMFELNYMIKRRVPNGPDPIHNRRAGNSHRPPRHA